MLDDAGDDLNVVISSPEGRVVLNGVDILASMDRLAIRMQQLEAEVSSLNSAVNKL